MKLLRLTAYTFALCAATAAFPQSSPNSAAASALFKEGFEKAQAGDSAIAIKLFERGLELDASDVKAQRLLAELLEREPGRAQEAKKAWQRLLEMSAKDTPENILATESVKKMEALVALRPVWRLGRKWKTIYSGKLTMQPSVHRVVDVSGPSYTVEVDSEEGIRKKQRISKDTFARVYTEINSPTGHSMVIEQTNHPYLLFPLELGSKWNATVTVTSEGKSNTVEVVYEIQRTAAVNTPKGPDTALVIKSEGQTCWYSPLIGDCVMRSTKYSEEEIVELSE